MGRLQRKKTSAGAKKKKRKNESKLAEGLETGASGAKRGGKSLESASDTRKKIASQTRKPVSADRGKVLGYIDVSIQFLREVKIELKKVTWPSRKQTLGSSSVVIILVLMISLFLFFIDSGLAGIIRLVLHSS